MALRNAFEDLATDSTVLRLRNLLKSLSKLTFDSSGQLRTYIASIATVTTVTTVTTGNISFGDSGKAATAITTSRHNAYLGSKKNLSRS
jgi:GTPase